MAQVILVFLAIGPSLFCLPDLTAARHRAVVPESVNRAVGLPQYHAGRALITPSV